MIYIPLGVAVVGFLITLVCKARLAPEVALSTSLVMAVLVPSNSPSRDILTASVVGVIAVLLLALFRNLLGAARVVANPFLIFYIFASSIVLFIESKGAYGLFVALTCSMYVLMAVVAPYCSSNGTKLVRLIIPAIIVFNLVLSAGEEFFGVKALWPLTNGSDNISSRINPIAPWLVGRAMGSTSHPIPFGILSGICLVWCLWLAHAYKNRIYLFFACMSGLVVLFSGTRSSILAVAVALAFWFVASAGAKRLPVFILVSIISLTLLSFLDLRDIPGLAGFYSSESYTHRADVLDFLPELLNRPVNEFLFGSGYGSISSLLQSSTFASGSGILVFDQELIRTFTATGLVGLTALGLSLVYGYRRGNLPSKLAIVFIVVNFFSFDVLSWNLLMVLFILATSGPLFGSSAAQKVNAPELRVRPLRHARTTEGQKHVLYVTSGKKGISVRRRPRAVSSRALHDQGISGGALVPTRVDI